MEDNIVSLVIVILAAGCHLAKAELVYIRDVTSDYDSRNLHGGLPSLLEFELTRGRRKTNLQLAENTRLNANAPMYESRQGPDGVPVTTLRDTTPLTTSKFYQDMKNGGVFHVQCKQVSQGPCVRQLTGNMFLSGTSYDLSPVPLSLSMRHLVNRASDEYPYQLSMSSFDPAEGVYRVRQATAANRQKNPEHNDYKRPPVPSRQDKQMRLAKLETRLETLIGLLQESRVKRESSPMLALEVLVVIDPSVWQKYSSKAPPVAGLSETEAAELHIRERFSHVVNGISLRYESIEDPELNIYVTVAGFLIYKTIDDSNPLSPNVALPEENGQVFADSDVYLDGLVPWAKNLTEIPDNDHILVFTDYDLYFGGNTSNDGVIGVAFLGGVCTEYRVSVNEDSDFFQVISVSTHELGHNLGSTHDGGNTDCPDSDKFIMAPFVASFSPGEPYTINPWRFSQCSITAFKNYIDSLGSDHCLLDHGDVFNETEFQSHVALLPGERHSAEEQCKMIRGDASTLCIEATDESICRLMLCTGDDGFCYYNAAAPGTPCGNTSLNKWCFEGQCVSRTTDNTTPSSSHPTPTTTNLITPSVTTPGQATASLTTHMSTSISFTTTSTRLQPSTPSSSLSVASSSSFSSSLTETSQTTSQIIPSSTTEFTASPTTTSEFTSSPTTTHGFTSSLTTTSEFTESLTTTSEFTPILTTTSEFTSSPTTTSAFTLNPTTATEFTASPTTTSEFTPSPTTTSEFTPSTTTPYQTTQRPSSTTTEEDDYSWWGWWWDEDTTTDSPTTTTTAPPCVDEGFYGYSCDRILYSWYRGRRRFMCWLFEEQCCHTCTSRSSTNKGW